VVALNVYALGAAGQVIPGSTLRHAIAGAFRSSGVGLQALSGILAGPVNTNGELALPSNTQLTVQPFRAIIQNTQDATAGAYVVPSPTVQTFTAGAAAGQNIPAQDASQFRRALVVVHVDDAQVAGSGGNAGTLEVLPGPLAATAGAAILPPTPVNALNLGELLIPPVGQTVTLTPYNPRTTTRGGILHVLTEAAANALASANLSPGSAFYAQDTGAFGLYDAAANKIIWYDTRWQTYTPAIKIGNNTTWTQGNSVVIGRYFRKGREVMIRVSILLGSTANFNSAASFVCVTAPTAAVPAASIATDGSSIPTIGTAEVINGGIAWGLVVVSETAALATRTFTFYPYGSATALSSAAGAGGSWNLWAAGQIIRFTAQYETNYE
jgi:hypothetical protein